MLTPPGHGRDLSCPTGRYPKRCSRFLIERPAPATARPPSHGDRTLLHAATDWLSHYPSVAAVTNTLTAAGADPNAPGVGPDPET